MNIEKDYLEDELYKLIKKDASIFKFLQIGSLDGIWYWDLENPENEWMSPEFWHLLGYSSDKKKHLASEWQDIINKDDLDVAIENFTKHCEDPNHPYDQIVRYRHKNGSTVWVRCRGIAIRDKDGNPIRMLGAHNDITALKRTEAALKQRTKELEEANLKLQKTISGIIPICASCKQIRDDDGYWNQVESYISQHSDITFSHGICPACAKKLYPDFVFKDKPGDTTT